MVFQPSKVHGSAVRAKAFLTTTNVCSATVSATQYYIKITVSQIIPKNNSVKYFQKSSFQ